MSTFTKIILLVFPLLPGELAAQYRFEKAVLINSTNVLPTNEVNAICKDSEGFIWMATGEGLCRFDGQVVKTYLHDSTDGSSLLDNSLRDLVQFRNELWIATHQGISVMNRKTGKFRHYQLTEKGKAPGLKNQFNQIITKLVKDRQGRLWVGTRFLGLYLYDETKDDFIPFVPDSTPPDTGPFITARGLIMSIEPSKLNDSVIYAGTPIGLQEVNKYTGRVKWHTFVLKDKNQQVLRNEFRRLYHHDDGLLYAGTWLAGVQVFDPRTQSFTMLSVKNPEAKELLMNAISSFYRKNDHEFWITTVAGLMLYDSRKKDVVFIKRNNQVDQKFYGVDFIDEANRIWHYNLNGVQYFDPLMQQFSVYSYDHLYGKNWAFTFYISSDDKGNNLTVCPTVTDALYLFNKPDQSWKKILLDKKSQQKISVRGFVKNRDGSFVISSDNGLFRFDPARGKLVHLPDPPEAKYKRWLELELDKKGNLWISADGDGLIRWNQSSGKYRLFNKINFQGRVEPLGRAYHLFADSKNNFWFARFNGFCVYLEQKDTLIYFDYNQQPANSFPIVHSFAEDRYGRIWISSAEGWIGYIEPSKPEAGIVKKIQLREKGLDGYAERLISDGNGNIWGYTNSFLFRINAADQSIEPFSLRYGLPNADFYHFSFLPSGEMVFGGRNQIILVNPSDLRRNPEKPRAYIDHVEVFNQPLVAGELSVASPLHLKPSQNYFSISFSARAFTMSSGVHFRYRLEGFDNWTESLGRRFANYTNVPGGDYKFQLQVANNEGDWTGETLEVPVHISIPWWQSWWFRIAFFLVLAAILYAAYEYRIRAVRKKDKIRSEYEKKLANVEMSALLAQMNPHFLFNSLNSIDSYIIKNESKKASEYLNNFARLMRLILQNSRSNYISLKDELEALDLYLQMESLRFRDKFDYCIDVDERINTESIVLPPLLIQPYVENAIWHGLMHKRDGVRGKVHLSLSKIENQIHCVIEDNGIGREKAMELAARKHGPRRHSMGMQITADRMEMINKLYNTTTSVLVTDLKDDGENAVGTRVELTIPV